MPIWIETILRSLGLFMGVFFTMRWTKKTPGVLDTVLAIVSILLGAILALFIQI